MAAERRRVKHEENKAAREMKRPTCYMSSMPMSATSCTHCVRRLLDSCFSLLDDNFHRLSEFDTFELLLKAINALLQRVAEDVAFFLAPNKYDDEARTAMLESIACLRWKAGPVFLHLTDSPADLQTEAVQLSQELDALLQEAVRRYSHVDLHVLRKLAPARLTLLDLSRGTSSSSSSRHIPPGGCSNNYRAQSVDVAKKLLRDNKAAGLTHNTPAPEWDRRPGKIRRYFTSTLR